MGWRYFLFTMASLMWGIRFFLFTLYESPKYLWGKVRTMKQWPCCEQRNVAKVNGKEGSVKLTADNLRHGANRGESGLGEELLERNVLVGGGDLRELVLKQLGVVDANHVKPLFATRKLAWSTGLLIVLWG
jgi:hypothetical protein